MNIKYATEIRMKDVEPGKVYRTLTGEVFIVSTLRDTTGSKTVYTYLSGESANNTYILNMNSSGTAIPLTVKEITFHDTLNP